MCRCPFCLDSKKDKNKTRFYIYEKAGQYTCFCHNCSRGFSLYKLLNKLDTSLANAYKFEAFKDTKPYTSSPIKAEERVKNETIVLENLGFTPLPKMPKNSDAMKYVEARKIPQEHIGNMFWSKDISVLEKLNPAYENRLKAGEERLIIPFHDKNGKLSGVTCRAIHESKLRYIAIRLSPEVMAYGFNKADFSKDIRVIEGPIDSMFIDNAVASGGSDFGRVLNLIPKTKAVLIFDNEPRGKEIVKLMEKYIGFGYRMMIWPPNWKYKDINEGIINGRTKGEVENMIISNTFEGLRLRLAMRDWKKC